MSTMMIFDQVAMVASVSIAVACCVVLAAIMVLTDDKRKSVLALFNSNVTAFMVPLLVVVVYVGIVWVLKLR
jgi:hypothetical protein